jgi:inner membrane transporter RhtA
MMALRRIEMGTFSILMSLEPAVGALLGFTILQQHLSLQQIAGVLAVMGASAGAVLMAPKESVQVPTSEGAALD